MEIYNFAKDYASSEISRFHMPGHKGANLHGLESLDITEIKGADYLYSSSGIIAMSESKTAQAYGSALTCYSTQGSTLSINSALCILTRFFGRKITVASPRNCHRAFLNACALLDIEPVWLYPTNPPQSLCQSEITAEDLRSALSENKVDAVYITSPDYLGNITDIASISKVCREFGTFLICDNAHGAYLKFLNPSIHPLDLGADIALDSAHKTLPVYTGGGYLHISKSAPKEFCELAKDSMALFGSTSPSYLIMQSLDLCADSLLDDLPKKIRQCCKQTEKVKALMKELEIPDISKEPMKITIDAEKIGFSGNELADEMRKLSMECEYSDHSYVVLMLSPYNSENDFARLESFLTALKKRKPLSSEPTLFFSKKNQPQKCMSVRQAMLSKSKKTSVDDAEGKICAAHAVSCQPSVAVVIAGEKITSETIKILKRYSIFQIDVL